MKVERGSVPRVPVSGTRVLGWPFLSSKFANAGGTQVSGGLLSLAWPRAAEPVVSDIEVADGRQNEGVVQANGGHVSQGAKEEWDNRAANDRHDE